MAERERKRGSAPAFEDEFGGGSMSDDGEMEAEIDRGIIEDAENEIDSLVLEDEKNNKV